LLALLNIIASARKDAKSTPPRPFRFNRMSFAIPPVQENWWAL